MRAIQKGFTLTLALLAAASSAGAQSSDKGLSVHTRSFKANTTIPKTYSGEGRDISPELSWANAPAGTKAFAVTCEDPDAPGGRWFHWIIFNIPAQTHNLPENVEKSPSLKDGSSQGTNDFGKIGYNGPMPPPGAGNHHYHFIVFALDNKLTLKPGCNKREFYAGVRGHVLAQGSVIGLYQR